MSTRASASAARPPPSSTADGVLTAFRDRSPQEIRDIHVSRLENGTWTPRDRSRRQLGDRRLPGQRPDAERPRPQVAAPGSRSRTTKARPTPPSRRRRPLVGHADRLDDARRSAAWMSSCSRMGPRLPRGSSSRISARQFRHAADRAVRRAIGGGQVAAATAASAATRAWRARQRAGVRVDGERSEARARRGQGGGGEVAVDGIGEPYNSRVRPADAARSLPCPKGRDRPYEFALERSISRPLRPAGGPSRSRPSDGGG